MFTPTEEQQAIIDFAKATPHNLIINALAGAAKTTTLELLTKSLPTGDAILFIAFNKRIAEEGVKRMPGHVLCQTINSVGHRAWGAAVGKRLTLDKDKSYNLLKRAVDETKGEVRAELYDNFADLKRAVGAAKLKGYIPSAGPQGKRLITWEEFDLTFEEPLPNSWRAIIDRVLVDSIKMSYAGTIDFDDQIYMPTLFGAAFPRFPLIMVDEAQDLSPLNHEMLKKLVVKRLIAVGDPLQSIYAFRGTVSSGMSVLQRTFNMTEMTLSISFRCPKAVAALARFRAPHMQSPEWAIEGEVIDLDSPKQLPWRPEDGAAVICRNNAPLFSLALELIKSGRGVKLLGADIGPALVKILKGLGLESMPAKDVHDAIENWKLHKLTKSRSPEGVHDRAECLHIFADQGDTLAAAVGYAEHLFAATGPIMLMTGHKSKGLEFDVVYFLDPWRVPSSYARNGEALEQELNLKYVIITRSKRKLVMVDTELYTEELDGRPVDNLGTVEKGAEGPETALRETVPGLYSVPPVD